MPDEVNIDELLDLESEEDRRRKIQVGGRESCPQSFTSPLLDSRSDGYQVY